MKEKDKDKVKEQYNIEKENEKTINKEITLIMQNSPSQKDLMEFMQKIREYRTRIYDLKMQLKEKIIDVYSIKETIKFSPYECKIKNGDYKRYEGYYDRQNELEWGMKYSGVSRKKSEKVMDSMTDVVSIERYYMGITERYNILKVTRIFRYYETEINFWEEMNLKQMMEIDQEEHFLE